MVFIPFLAPGDGSVKRELALSPPTPKRPSRVRGFLYDLRHRSLFGAVLRHYGKSAFGSADRIGNPNWRLAASRSFEPSRSRAAINS